MTRAPSPLADLLAVCDAQGIWLLLADDGGLTIDAPQDSLTPDLLGRLKAHKGELLAMLRPVPEPAPVNQADAAAVWQAALDRLEGDPLFPPDVLEGLRAADVQWIDEPAPAPPSPTSDAAAKPTKAVCRCGSTTGRDVVLRHAPHNGTTIRRDCGRCGRFIKFPIWYGNGHQL